MIKNMIILLSAVFVLVLSGCSSWGEASVDGKRQLINDHLKNMKYSNARNQESILNPNPKYTVMVRRVIDGDTIVFSYNK